MSEHPTPNYLGIMIYLGILTAIEVTLALVPLNWTVVVTGMIVLMLVKAVLIALFFMHLRFERITLFFVCSTPLVLALVLFFGLTPDT